MSTSYKLIIGESLNREKVEEIIFGLGFERDNLKDRYFYFNQQLSIKGCWFSLNRKDCVATTLMNKSHHDVEMQILAIKSIQNIFGGIIVDSKTEKEIIPQNKVRELSEFEIASKRTYLNFIDNIKRVEKLIEEVDEKTFDIENRSRIQITNPSIIRHNTLVPFCVSILEDFLRTIFKQYLLHNEEKMNLYFDGKKGEMPYSAVKALFTGEVKLIDKIMKDYSFQNFNSTNKAFEKYMDIKLFDILKTDIPYSIGNNVKLISILEELIKIRHKIVHEAALHGKLGTSKMIKYCHYLEKFGEVFIRAFEEKNNLNLFNRKTKQSKKKASIKVSNLK